MNRQARCAKCNGTGWLHGCQRWTPAKMRRGTPYYSARCDCREQHTKRRALLRKLGEQ